MAGGSWLGMLAFAAVREAACWPKAGPASPATNSTAEEKRENVCMLQSSHRRAPAGQVPTFEKLTFSRLCPPKS
ncbi:hypothetical protein GCM10027422_21520 [Hymenobacter arcticus]